MSWPWLFIIVGTLCFTYMVGKGLDNARDQKIIELIERLQGED